MTGLRVKREEQDVHASKIFQLIRNYTRDSFIQQAQSVNKLMYISLSVKTLDVKCSNTGWDCQDSLSPGLEIKLSYL